MSASALSPKQSPTVWGRPLPWPQPPVQWQQQQQSPPQQLHQHSQLQQQHGPPPQQQAPLQQPRQPQQLQQHQQQQSLPQQPQQQQQQQSPPQQQQQSQLTRQSSAFALKPQLELKCHEEAQEEQEQETRQQHQPEPQEPQEQQQQPVHEQLEEPHAARSQEPPQEPPQEPDEEVQQQPQQQAQEQAQEQRNEMSEQQQNPFAPPLHLPPYLPQAWASVIELDAEPVLGIGAFAQVLRTKSTEGTAQAVKVLSRAAFTVRGIEEQVDAEVSALRRAAASDDCRQVVRLLGDCEEAGVVFLRMEMCRIDLQAVAELRPDRRLAESELQGWAKELLQGLKGLHGLGILHRDVKPANLLIGFDGGLRITDFGWSTELRQESRSLAGTFQFMAPEVLAQSQIQTCKVDLWSAGISLYQLLLGRPLLGSYLRPGVTNLSLTDPNRATATKIFWLLGEIQHRCPLAPATRPPYASEAMWAFLTKLLTAEVACRISSLEALADPWLHEASPLVSASSSPSASPHMVPMTAPVLPLRSPLLLPRAVCQPMPLMSPQRAFPQPLQLPVQSLQADPQATPSPSPQRALRQPLQQLPLHTLQGSPQQLPHQASPLPLWSGPSRAGMVFRSFSAQVPGTAALHGSAAVKVMECQSPKIDAKGTKLHLQTVEAHDPFKLKGRELEDWMRNMAHMLQHLPQTNLPQKRLPRCSDSPTAVAFPTHQVRTRIIEAH